MTMTTATRETRAPPSTRSDGDRSRQRILEAAAQLATVQGLDRLSIGELAAHIGMSKSGLYAHFRSKEELQLATIDAAEAIFDEAVVGADARGQARHPGRAGPDRRLPRPPRRPDLPGRLLLRLRLGRDPVPARARSRSGSRSSTAAGAATSSRTSASPRRPATSPRARTSTRSSSRSTPTCSTRTPPSGSAATPRSSRAGEAVRRPAPECPATASGDQALAAIR